MSVVRERTRIQFWRNEMRDREENFLVVKRNCVMMRKSDQIFSSVLQFDKNAKFVCLRKILRKKRNLM